MNPVFQAENIVELCRRHVDETPIAPSERLGKEVSAELEYALLSALEKSRAKRPQTARDLAQLLEKCPAANSWSIEDGDAWWGRHERGQHSSATIGTTHVAELEQTMIANAEETQRSSAPPR